MGVTREGWEAARRAAGVSGVGTAVGEEFMVYYPLRADFLPILASVIAEER